MVIPPQLYALSLYSYVYGGGRPFPAIYRVAGEPVAAEPQETVAAAEGALLGLVASRPRATAHVALSSIFQQSPTLGYSLGSCSFSRVACLFVATVRLSPSRPRSVFSPPGAAAARAVRVPARTPFARCFWEFREVPLLARA
ncbi:hypothetical protein EAI_04557 [Harpegnathos saltator]|uniref:Uncharacterized protein n=1 Tax=Harpegnathos saltator TaxID=610380 RepID=E2C8X4_HARSA|nr:hypothetical protein EAI_04557 [Harpegnathos saltator]